MVDEAKPGALQLSMEKSKDEKEPPAEPDRDEEMRSTGSAVMRAMRRGDADVFVKALDAFLDARGK